MSSPSAGAAIRCDNLTREFDAVRAVDALTLEIPGGSVFALLGPNGAGKTTTLRLLTGLLAPTSGQARVLGLDPCQDGDRVRAQIGVLLEDAGLYEDLSAGDNLEFYARIQRVPARERGGRIRNLLERQGLWDVKDRRVRTFSRGMKQRLALARAMVARPRILFLDEPTSGLDPAATRQVRETILELAHGEDITVFLNTHHLDEVERVSDTVGIIKKGRLLAFGSSREVRERASGVSIVVRTEGLEPWVAGHLGNLPGVAQVTATGNDLRIEGGDGLRPADLVRFLVDRGVGVCEVRQERASLEDVFLQIVKEES